MGERVRVALEAEPRLALAAALESPGHPGIGRAVAEGVRVEHDAAAALSGCDVVIDFSVPAATLGTLRAASEAGVAYVTGTTGFSAAQRSEIERLAERVPVVLAPNFSVAVNVLTWLVREAAESFITRRSATRPAVRRCGLRRRSPRRAARS
jgi:4-hydroxy-tetrahydrodipicolinate reductase